MTNGSSASAKSSPDIDAVRNFWDTNPLWTGEATAQPGTREFFEEHRRVYYQDCFAGALDPRIFKQAERSSRVLDLGCGIGFWLVEFWERGFHNLSGADLSPRSLEIAKTRCAVYGITPELSVHNAEDTGFEAQLRSRQLPGRHPSYSQSAGGDARDPPHTSSRGNSFNFCLLSECRVAPLEFATSR